ncbi:MAG: hypothetical protein M1274_10345 [Actinobacteria bacterium]|nr:hypothetical protein [Actinomycetota bacterium]
MRILVDRPRGRKKAAQTTELPNPATVAVVGGGPAGSFFAIRLLDRAKQLGRSINVTIFEKKSEVCFYQPEPFCSWEGCNYCAGGISPRLADILREIGLLLPDEIVESRASEVIVHGDWKSIQLPVPEGREMMSVFRGSRPRQRTGRYGNFDGFLLRSAETRGAGIVTAEVTRVSRSQLRRPLVTYRTAVSSTDGSKDETLEVDFVVFAAGVNRFPGGDLKLDPTFQMLREVLPGLRPPRVRRAAIAELQAEEELLRPLDGEVHFAQYGSKEIDIEMSSLLPKGKWITVVLLGKTIDHADPSRCLEIVQQFVELPHIRLLMPPAAELRPGCCCHPNMTVGAAGEFLADGVAVAGDMAVSRLYKDGLYSAYVTASRLADCILEHGTDRATLTRQYEPVIRGFDADNRYGRAIFLLSRWVFGNPALSRVLYQALITEVMTKPRDKRWMGKVLWQIASGDAGYRHILAGMFHPSSIWTIITGGVLTTIRNKLTERIFGLDWAGFGRFPTGVPFEDVEPKRRELFSMLGVTVPQRQPQVERMFSIQIRAGAEAVMRQLGAFGDPGRGYFTPRFLNVHRTCGAPNQVGTVVHYENILRGLSFRVALEKVVPGRYLLYRILDGFGRGGIFAFDIETTKPGISLLTTYVGFDFPRGSGPLSGIGWAIGRRVFPGFAHDVLWNHSLCRIKHLAELEEAGH